MKCACKAGLLNRRVTLQDRDIASDGQGGFTESWQDVTTVWAQITPLSGYERMQAMQLATPLTHKVLMRYNPMVTADRRLKLGARVLEIKEVINADEAKAWLRLLCVETENLSEGTPSGLLLAITS